MNLKFGWLVIKDSLCVSESKNRTSGYSFSPPPSPRASDGQAVRKRAVPLFRIHTCGRPYPCSHMDFTARYVSPLLGERIHQNEISRFEPLNLAKSLLSRPSATLSSIGNGGEGRGEEALWFMGRAAIAWPCRLFECRGIAGRPAPTPCAGNPRCRRL